MEFILGPKINSIIGWKKFVIANYESFAEILLIPELDAVSKDFKQSIKLTKKLDAPIFGVSGSNLFSFYGGYDHSKIVIYKSPTSKNLKYIEKFTELEREFGKYNVVNAGYMLKGILCAAISYPWYHFPHIPHCLVCIADDDPRYERRQHVLPFQQAFFFYDKCIWLADVDNFNRIIKISIYTVSVDKGIQHLKTISLVGDSLSVVSHNNSVYVCIREYDKKAYGQATLLKIDYFGERVGGLGVTCDFYVHKLQVYKNIIFMIGLDDIMTYNVTTEVCGFKKLQISDSAHFLIHNNQVIYVPADNQYSLVVKRFEDVFQRPLWQYCKLLFLAFHKNDPRHCVLSRLPKDLIRVVGEYCTAT